MNHASYILSRPEYWLLLGLWAALFVCMCFEHRGHTRKVKALALRYCKKIERQQNEIRCLKGRLESRKYQHNAYLEQQLSEAREENATLRAQLKIKTAIIEKLEVKPA